MTSDATRDKDPSRESANMHRADDSIDPSPAGRFRDQAASRQVRGDEDEDGEQHLWSGGYSPKAMIGTWFFVAIATFSILAVSLGTGAFSPLIALLIGAGVWAVAGLVYAWRRFGVHYELTTQRFVHQSGIVTRQTDRIEVIDIDDVTFTQGPFERIFNVGRIVLTSSDRTHPVLSMIGIADVKRVAGLIDDIRRKERRRRSLHIEAI